MSTQSAPGDLERVRAFVNTYEVERGTDELSSPETLASWLSEQGLWRGGRSTSADLAAARRLREAVRNLLLANSGLSVRKEAALTLTRAARLADLRLSFSSSGHVRLEPASRGVDAALGRLVAIAAGAMADGTWARLKVCLAEDCRWAFYDRAPNRSRHWCSMASCGNRAKARAYRRRHAVA